MYSFMGYADTGSPTTFFSIEFVYLYSDRLTLLSSTRIYRWWSAMRRRKKTERKIEGGLGFDPISDKCPKRVNLVKASHVEGICNRFRKAII